MKVALVARAVIVLHHMGIGPFPFVTALVALATAVSVGQQPLTDRCGKIFSRNRMGVVK